ncbi:MAG: hypothetical protein HFI78_09870 [Lachnospiraceae bacterium]|jgi:hypothetical protein|nr:hypothetical protein [Lachnospiraceae bacterium]
MRKVGNRKRNRFVYMFFLCFFAMACKRVDNRNTEMEVEMEQEIVEEIGTETESKDDSTDVFTIYTTEAKISDQEISAVYTDDWSFLNHMDQTEFNYAYQDGKVYYRQYHKDSLDGWELIASKDKEIISIDEKGEKTLFFQIKDMEIFILLGNGFI